MKICIWFQTTDGPWGGANQFLRALSAELRRTGHQVTDTPRGDEDIVLVNAFVRAPGVMLRARSVDYIRHFGVHRPWSRVVPQALTQRFSRTRAAFVHRLDGVAHLIRGVPSEADAIHQEVNALCDYTIFQSRYCVSSFREEGGVDPKRSTIIYNAVPGDVFFPASATPKETPKRLRIGASSWSPNPRKGFATIAALSEVEGVEVHFAGRWAEGIDPKNVIMRGGKSTPELAGFLREMDGMAHAALNEPCSNAILEGLATALPMLYLDSGGNRELAGEYGVAIGTDLRQSVAEFRELYQEFRGKLIADRAKFLIEAVAQRYVAAFEEARAVRG